MTAESLQGWTLRDKEREKAGMGMILTGIVVAVAIAVGAGYFLLNTQQQQPAWQVYSSDSTRVGDPGHNLVGPNWTGESGDGSDVVAGDEETPSS